MPQEDTLKRLGRILSLIGRLNEGLIKVKAVADEYGVDKRTIQRDLAIMHKAGFFTQTTGDGWYQFAEGISLKNRKLSNEQYNALNALAAFSKNVGAGISGSYEKLFQHITGYTPFETYIVPVMPRIISDTIPHIKEIEEAIEWGKQLEIEYQNEVSPKSKTHRICPIKVLIADGFAYIFAAFKDKPGIFPKFRIDRIKSLKVLDGELFSQPEGAEEALAKARNVWGTMSDTDRKIKIKLKIEGWARDYFLRHEVVGGQELKKQKDDSLVLTASICNLPEIIPHILRWLPHVTVISPAELKEEVRWHIDEYLKNQP